ncbi:ATP-binding cassette domain-containing protein [Clostridium novyi]|uniref:ATP-binding cassette domain-containing protein n=1 Tax=Clostridium novyi TaxID=1542 RepID=UPI00068D3AAC|nr:ATP-binding cassette domain-containing protein [Clostridium novyi]
MASRAFFNGFIHGPEFIIISILPIFSSKLFGALFNDTVRNNIRYANMNTTDEKIEEVCKLANCYEFIKNLESGYDTLVGENGGQLSGGERQRISVARALIKNSSIILLDEATSALDIENEIKVKKAIKNLLNAKKTVVMIAHTLSIVQKADKIIVISNGKVEEEGTHEKLLKDKGKYFHMWNAEQNLN